MLLRILYEKAIQEHGAIIEAFYHLNKKYKNYFDYDKVWEVLENKEIIYASIFNFDK